MKSLKKLSLYLISLVLIFSSCGKGEKENEENGGNVDAVTKVRVKTMEPEVFNHYIVANGSVEAINDAFISPESPGQIKKIYVKEGQRVSKGQLLLSLNAGVIGSTINEVQTGLKLADTLYQKQKTLWEQGIGSEVQYLQAKNAKESLEKKLETLYSQMAMSTIRAPFGGIVDEIFLMEGEMASPGMQVIQIVDLEKLNINAELSEAYLSKIDKGDIVKVSFPAYNDVPELNNLEVPVFRIGNTVNKDSRTFKIQLQMNNIENRLKPNIISIIKINDYSNEKAIVVPENIIKDELVGGSKKKTFVFVAEEENGKVLSKKREVVLGLSYDGITEITQGLNPGDKVITDGYNIVTAGSVVEIVK
ncbi:MAG: efflux RND transporter periplasmic adaptor subunit [Bacteroidales bacterium]|nr:efflux RND transporter periplasmic adaptor subunit [Bacteroidales bacterium]